MGHWIKKSSICNAWRYATFEFCIVLTAVARSLFYLSGPTEKIQRQSLDSLEVVRQVEIAGENIAFTRNDSAKEYFSRCFECAVEMASLIDIVPSMPQIAARNQPKKM